MHARDVCVCVFLGPGRCEVDCTTAICEASDFFCFPREYKFKRRTERGYPCMYMAIASSNRFHIWKVLYLN